MTVTITKGLLQALDQANYDGVADTVTRRDSTGGTVSGLPIGGVVDVLATYGNGEDRTQATINRATNAIGSANRTLMFRPGTWTITSNLTIASNFSIYMPAGAVFDVASGATLTIQGAFLNDHATYSSGSGTVTLADKSFAGNVDIADHNASTTGLKLNSTLVTATADELNLLDGVTSTTAELNLVDGLTDSLNGLTATATELNLLDGATVTTSEINRLDGTIPAVQETLQIYSGYVDSAASAEVVPSGWSVAKGGTGLYDVTHNLGLSTPVSDLIVTANPSGTNASRTCEILNQAANSFRIAVNDSATDGGPATDSNLVFIAILRV